MIKIAAHLSSSCELVRMVDLKTKEQNTINKWFYSSYTLWWKNMKIKQNSHSFSTEKLVNCDSIDSRWQSTYFEGLLIIICILLFME